MNKLFHTLFVVLLMSSSATATSQPRASSAVTPAKPLPFQQNQKASYLRSLSGLYSVQSFRKNSLTQPHDDFDALYQLGQSAQSELELLSQQAAMLSGTQLISAGIKSQERAQAKIDGKLDGQVAHITDIVRTSLVAQDIPSMMAAFEHMTRGHELVEVKNRFKTPGPSGYRDLKVLVRLPESQMIAEIQFHLEDFATIKNGDEHENYEQIQQIERRQQAEQRELNDLERARIAQLRQESQQLYQEAWDGYLTQNARSA